MEEKEISISGKNFSFQDHFGSCYTKPYRTRGHIISLKHNWIDFDENKINYLTEKLKQIYSSKTFENKQKDKGINAKI